MTNIIKISIFTGVIAVAFGAFAFIPAVQHFADNTAFAPAHAFALGSGGDGGCCGDGGGGGDYGGGGGGDPYTPPVIVPSCDAFSGNPTTLPAGGGNVTLSWATTNANSVSINNGVGNVSLDGSKIVHVSNDTTFVLTATYSTLGRAPVSDTCQVTITVQDEPAAVCDSFTADPSILPYGGGNVTLTWNTTNANSVSINNGIGAVSADGSLTYNVGNTTTFVLTASGTGGNDTCQATVTVRPQDQVAVCDFLNASDTSLPEGGGNVTLSWGTTNATSVFINNGIGSVSADGSMNVFVNDDITYTLTASNAHGSDTCSVTINVEEDQDEVPRCDFLTVDDDDVEEGDSVTLRWGTTNADSVYINNGIGNVSDDGSRSVRVYDDTTFILTATNDGRKDTCSVHVNVDEDDDNGPSPRCDLEISDRKVKVGDKVTLEWETDHAEEITIDDDHGNEIFNSTRSKYFDGEIDVRVYEDTEFTLTVENDEGKRRCRVEVEVEEDDVLVFTKRQQPLVAGIALTQVPYTGFEAGPVMTTIFYVLLTLWALFIAYMLVIRRSSIFGFSLPQPVDHQAVSIEDEFKKKVKMLAAKYSHQPIDPQV